MAHFLRLIFALLLIAFAGHAMADSYPAKIQWRMVPRASFDLPEPSCQDYASAYGYGYSNVSKQSESAYLCYVTSNGGPPVIANTNIVRVLTCPSGGQIEDRTVAVPMCINAPACEAGQVRQADGSCAKPCESGYVSGVTGSSYFGSDGSSDCLNNCTYSISVDMCATLTNGQGGCVGAYGNGTGASCSSPTNNKAPTPEANCMSQGKSYISVGGVTSCVSAGSQGSTPVTTKNNSSSSSNSSTKDANGNPTGSSSSNSTSNSSATFNGDGTVVVVTTTEKTNPDGTKETKTETKTVSQTSYCAENPTAAQCKAATDSDISGACDAVACKGDAIQCAMAKEQARRNCEWFKENATAKALGEAMTNGTDTTPNPADSSNRETVNVQSSLDSSSPISASCFTDLTVTLLGQSATLPLSDWCPFFEALGYIFLALSYMAALRIVAGVIV